MIAKLLTYQRDAIESECCVFVGAGEGTVPSSYSSDDDPSSLVVDAGQMIRFVTKTESV